MNQSKTPFNLDVEEILKEHGFTTKNNFNMSELIAIEELLELTTQKIADEVIKVIDETLNLEFRHRHYTNPQSKQMQKDSINALEQLKQKLNLTSNSPQSITETPHKKQNGDITK